MEEDAPTSSSSGSGDVTPTQSSSSSGSTTKMSSHERGDGCKETTKKRKAEEEHPEDPERDDGKWMRTDGNKRKAGEESEESRLRKTVRYLKELDEMEDKKEPGKVQEVVEVAEVEVNEEEEQWMTEEESRRGNKGGDLDPEQVRDQDVQDVSLGIVGRCDIKNEQDAHDNEMCRSGQEGRQWENVRHIQTGGARFQTEALRTQRRLVRGDATVGSEEGFIRVRCRDA